jgi:hypothetical protein
VSVHHTAADDQAMWRLVVMWADDEFVQRMVRITSPNLLEANTMVRPIIRMRVNLRIKYIGYLGTNPGMTGKFGLSAASILSVFTKFTI